MIETRNLTRTFGTSAAVENLNLRVERGELFGFLGPNGAGKTTTIRMLVGLLRPTSGSVIVGGRDVQAEPIASKRLLGYLAQSPLLYEKLTGREFLRFLGGLYGMRDEEIKPRSEYLLRLTDLLLRADHLIESYSGGMKHKIGLCGAMLHQPKVLILDEPLSGMDPHTAKRIKDVLRQLCQRGVTVFMSTHILEIAERVCDRVGILDRGHLIAVGTMNELRSLASSPITDKKDERSLENLFLQLTAADEMSDVISVLS